MHYDKLKTKPITKKYIEGWNRIFNKSLKDKSFRKKSKSGPGYFIEEIDAAVSEICDNISTYT